MEDEPKNLPAIIEKSGIDTQQALEIQTHFEAFLQQIKDWKEKAFAINVTSVDQVFEIAEAKKGYKIVRGVRLNAEAIRKELKEDSLRKGKLIDGIAGFVKDMVAPIEEHLEKQAKFAEIKEKEDLEKKVNERSQALLQYVQDISIYNLATMDDEAFTSLLAEKKESFEKKQEEDRKAKEIEDQKKEDERIENERIRNENEKLIEDQKEKDAEIKRLEDEKKKRDEDDEKERLRLKKIEDDKLKSEHDAKMAPDKDKLTVFAESIKNIQVPGELSNAALEIVKVAQGKLLTISQEVRDKIKTL